MLNANLTSSERCVGLHRLMCTYRAKDWNCVIAAAHKHTFLLLNKGAFRFLKQDDSSVSQLPDFKQAAFLSSALLAVFIFLSEQLTQSPAWTV